MREIRLPCGKVALVSDEDHYRVASLSWSDRGGGYIRARFKKSAGGDGSSVYLHRFIMNAPIGMDVDHIDGNPLNNTRENLQILSRSRNIMKVRRGGVTPDRGQWRARLRIDGKMVRLGLYADEEIAWFVVNEARDAAWDGRGWKK